VAHSRKIGGGRPRRRTASRTKPDDGAVPKPARQPVSDDLAAIREWGRANGFSVSDRGRISGLLRSAYEAAQE